MQRIIARVMVAALSLSVASSCSQVSQFLGTEFKAKPSPAFSVKPCPPMPKYTDSEQAAALRVLNEDLRTKGYGATVLDQIVDDYYTVREQCDAGKD